MNKYKIFFCIIWQSSLFTMSLSQDKESFISSIDIFVEDEIYTEVDKPTFFKGHASCIDKEIIDYEWDYDGDGKYDFSSSIPNSKHTYKKEGIYRARFKVVADDESYDFIFINVYVGIPEKRETETRLTGKLYSSTVDRNADGFQTNFAILIGGPDTQRWNTTVGFYNLLITNYHTPPENIYVLNPWIDPPHHSQEIIDYLGTIENFELVIQEIADVIDDDDLFIFFDEWHGKGYCGYVSYHPTSIALHGYFGSEPYIAGMEDEKDYLESNIDVSIICGNGSHDGTDYHYGLDEWGIYDRYTQLDPSQTRSLWRYLAKSTFQNIYVESIGNISDDDIYIEKFKDYVLGDVNKNGIEDEGEIWDSNGNGILPVEKDKQTLEYTYDEEDWGAIDEICDNCTDWHNESIGNIPYILFDKDFDNTIDIDLNATMSTPTDQLIADGTDFDNNGCIDNLDLNEDGYWNAWIGIDEKIALYGSWVTDNELRDYFNLIEYGKKIVITNTCYGGGLLEDLSNINTISMAGCEPICNCRANLFSGLVSQSFGDMEADENEDELISAMEAFNYADENESQYAWDIFSYDDNGDGIEHNYPIPNGGDGVIGGETFLLMETFCPEHTDLSLTGSVNNEDKNEHAQNSIASSESIINNSRVFYIAGSSITLQNSFTIDNSSEIYLNIMEISCIE